MSLTADSSALRSIRSAGAAVRERLESPVTTYYLLLSVTSILVSFGLIMVLSASMIVSLKEDGSSFTIFLSQLQFAVIGAVAMYWAAGRSIAFWKKLAVPALAGAIVLQLLVFTPLGMGYQGNRNWLDFGVASVQPSELGKIALVLFGAAMLARKQRLLGDIRHALIPFVFPAAGLVLLLVMLGHDLGTAMVLASIVVGMLFAAGVSLRWFLVGSGVLVALGLVAARTSSNRMERISIWLDRSLCNPTSDPELYYGICRQPLHGRYALADGGWWGVGLGASREKWQWLSEPHNDFIFAIIGEELGLPGTLLILGLFAVLVLACNRIVARTDDFFVRIATAGILTWIVVQAIINIGAVIGLLPVIGVPLPFVSSGGSSLITTMLASGILLSFARREPGCEAALAARPSLVRRSLAVLPPIRRGAR
ncbi:MULTISPECIES: putative lipid II flippase FtsW [unclassified Janibacter]|uniref:putative lipid II flippase FtsW n=1 Tax=unclassified Janibacter TaxID=2649294 RepID=UPI003CFFE65E